ncbi:MAG TPA: DUF998 domain-containing protein [Clostridiales bacterium]|jgi:hypothetical membrane protein|nr:DUF998 domain-containing protein [Clostridiales bacterium]
MERKKNLVQWLALLGVAGTIFYFLHVILGKANYPGYNPLAQAVSDLTAATAPSREIASAYSTVYAFFTVAACTLLCVFYQGKVNKVFRLGIYLFAVMEWTSAVGYTLFPLSASGYAGSFQDIMHMVVTAIVVLLSIASMILITVGCFQSRVHKLFGIFTIAVLGIMALGSITTGIVPVGYFGVAERLSVYSVVIYSAALSLFTYRYPVQYPKAI